MALSETDQHLPSGNQNEKVESVRHIAPVQSGALVFWSPPNPNQVVAIASLPSNEGLQLGLTNPPVLLPPGAT